MAPAETGGPRGLDGVHSQPLSPSGETCLHQAAALGQRTICHYIVEAGASLMKTDQQVSRGIGQTQSYPSPNSARGRGGSGGGRPQGIQSWPSAQPGPQA